MLFVPEGTTCPGALTPTGGSCAKCPVGCISFSSWKNGDSPSQPFLALLHPPAAAHPQPGVAPGTRIQTRASPVMLAQGQNSQHLAVASTIMVKDTQKPLNSTSLPWALVICCGDPAAAAALGLTGSSSPPEGCTVSLGQRCSPA